MAGATDVKKIYQQVVQDVCTAVREALSEEGYDDHTLQELRTLWLARLESSKALEPVTTSAVDEATTRVNRRTTTNNDMNHSTTTTSNNIRQTTGIRPTTFPQASTSNLNSSYHAQQMIHTGSLTMTQPGLTAPFISPANFNRPQNSSAMGNNSMKTSNQLDGTHDDILPEKKNPRRKKSKRIQISFQLDGTGPIATDDEDEEEDNEAEGNDVPDELDEDDDEDGNEEGREDPDPLCSDDDVSDDEPAELFDTDNVVVCQYDKISRTKNKWRFTLKSGVMNINGRDYVFSKASGEADW